MIKFQSTGGRGEDLTITLSPFDLAAILEGAGL